MSFEEFQDGHHGIHLGYQKGTILAILNLCVTVMPPIKFWLSHQVLAIRLKVWEKMLFEEFQDGLHSGHLGYWNGTILAILNLCVTVMPPIKFQLNHCGEYM